MKRKIKKFWDYAQNGSEAAQDVEVLRLVN
jgi:hypothetical protein